MKRILPAITTGFTGASAALVLAAMAISIPAKAERQQFDATCFDATKCTVTVDGEQLNTSRGLTINAEDIVYLSVSDKIKKRSLCWCFFVAVLPQEYSRHISGIQQ